jgi:hypothetical protein
VLDEPAAVQSDPTVLNLQLRALGKEAAGVKMQVLGTIPHNATDRWGFGQGDLAQSPGTVPASCMVMPEQLSKTALQPCRLAIISCCAWQAARGYLDWHIDADWRRRRRHITNCKQIS